MPHSEDLLSIGRLGRKAGLSVKALRHYDRLGLFPASFVDPANGYRWYAADQVPLARLIGRLRSLDMPLDTVRTCLESGGDADVVADALMRHRRRLESRLTRIRGDLHSIDHFLTDGMGLTMSTFELLSTELGDERKVAVDLFNAVWTAMGKEDRSPADDDEMVHAAHASAYHWRRVGAAANFVRSEWQVSRVYSVLGRAEPCLHHAQRCLELCQQNAIADWDLAFAHEALARAHAVAGDAAAARTATEQALTAAEDIADPEDRELVLGDLESIPGQPRFW